MSPRYRIKDGVKLIALLLMICGAVGIALALWELGQMLRENRISILLILLMLAVFVGSVWTGFGLWKGKRWAFLWATILFIAQSPMLNVDGFVYEFYTGVNGGIIVNHEGQFDWNLTLGAALQVGFVAGGADFAWGLNLFPILVFLYLTIVPWPLREPILQAPDL